MNFKLSQVYILINEVGQWFYELGHVTFLKIYSNLQILHCVFTKSIPPYVNFIVGGKVGISSKIVHIWEYF